MPISYVEEIASEYYRLKGYFIQRDYTYRKQTKNVGKPTGWKDIDIIAINDKEVLVIECKSQVREKNKARHIINSMLSACKEVSKMPIVKKRGLGIKKILVVDKSGYYYSVKKHLQTIEGAGFKIIDLIDLAKDIIKILNERTTLGKEENTATRTIKALIDWNLINLEHEKVE